MMVIRTATMVLMRQATAADIIHESMDENEMKWQVLLMMLVQEEMSLMLPRDPLSIKCLMIY